MAEILKGAAVAAALDAKTRQRGSILRERGVTPTLAILRVGEREEDLSYERSAARRCERLGLAVRHASLPADVGEKDFLDTLAALNRDPKVHGILLLRPLPAGLDEEKAAAGLNPEKDVDGITDTSLAGVFAGSDRKGFAPCTPRACLEILDYYGVNCEGKRAVVVGRSLVVGRPLAMMLLKRNATVTLCHTRTADLPARCREADLLIAAAGQPEMIDERSLRPGQVVLDVGIHTKETGELCGDVNARAAGPIVQALTPVPGGVGAVTTAVLAHHVAEAALRQTKDPDRR